MSVPDTEQRYKLCECGRTFNVKDGVPTLAPEPIAKDKRPDDVKVCYPCFKVWPKR